MKTSPRLLSLLSVVAFVAFVSVVTAAPIAKGPDATIDIRPTSRNAADAAKVLANLTEEEKAIIEILKNMNAETRELLTKATDTVLKNARKNARMVLRKTMVKDTTNTKGSKLRDLRYRKVHY